MLILLPSFYFNARLPFSNCIELLLEMCLLPTALLKIKMLKYYNIKNALLTPVPYSYSTVRMAKDHLT